ncbi:MAG: argininosuccinate synthase [Bacteroidales bacterium]|jgi:argininosuccinate synthase|nr:argininosuccinate synthase [Bacteroidales bacterium]
MSNTKSILLAFSGGLDTTFCSIYLAKEKNYEVHSAIVNTGGFDSEELKVIETHALKLGVASHKVLDVTNDYYERCIKYMLFGNSLRNRNYPLSVSSERSFQAIAIVEYAREMGFEYIAHGSTAAGNDQVRFDLAIRVLAPEIEVITPIRELKISREKEIEYLAEYDIHMRVKDVEYSINKGLWGTSIGGKETLTSDGELPDSAYPSGEPKSGTEIIEIEFKAGEPVAVNGTAMNPVEAIRKLDEIGGSYAIGRDVHVGDTIIGIKGRVGFEAAAARILIDAHLGLEKHVLTRWQLHWKEQIGAWYGLFVHEAQFLEPVMRDLEAFLESSQKNVSGTVSVRLRPYSYVVTGIKSEYDLMDSAFAAYGEENRDWSAADVDGFTLLLANQQKIWYSKNGDR